MIVKVEGTCQFAGCESPATHIAVGRGQWNPKTQEVEGGHPVPDCYCEDYAYRVAGEKEPEYIQACSNCGCVEGVN